RTRYQPEDSHMTSKLKIPSTAMATREPSSTQTNAFSTRKASAAEDSPIKQKMQNSLLSYASVLLATVLFSTGAMAQANHTNPQDPKAAVTDKAADSDRATAYYHLALAHTYAEMATTQGHPEYATRAIEEYKLALNADPTSPFLNNGLAELYYKTGKIR